MTQTASPLDSSLQNARRSVATMFCFCGVAMASWVTRVPTVQEGLHLRNSTLGLALLMVSVGALISMPLVGRLVTRAGSDRPSTWSVTLLGVSVVLPGFATGILTLCLTLFLFGCAYGAANVSINSQAVTVERGYGRPIMGSFHAIYSLGGILGAVLGSVAAAWHSAPWVHLALVGSVLVLITPMLDRFFIRDGGEVVRGHAQGGRRPAALWLLGVIAFCTMLGEGAVADWSAVFLRQVSGVSPSVAALGFGAFSAAMTIGRLVADRTTAVLGPTQSVRLGGVLAVVGLLVAMLFPSAPSAIAGFALVGIGFSSIVPAVFSAAGRMLGVAPAVGIATVSTMGYFGFLVGPPAIGFASEYVTLRWAVAIVFAASCVTVALANLVRAEKPAERDDPAEAVAASAAVIPA